MARRLVDVVVALTALVVFSPLLLLIAVAIMTDSPGGPLYLTWRAGKDGRSFRMWKFRTMIPGAAQLGGPLTCDNDPRVTRLGRMLRRIKLDELPQFLNVLLGDMTLVGPRPEAPEIVLLYNPSQRAVLRVKPGITGCVQLEAGYDAETLPHGALAVEYYVQHLMDRKVRRDLEYLERRTVVSDAKIVMATAGLVLRAIFRS